MRLVRKLSLIVLVWATASSMMLASTPYYVCRCPDGTTKYHFTANVATEGSCCTTNCCVPEVKVKSCCQASKKKIIAKATCCTERQNLSANPDGAPVIGKAQCQKILVQPEVRTFSQMEAKAFDSDTAGVSTLGLVVCLDVPIDTNQTAFLWRIDKSPPPTDFVTVLQRLTI